MAGLTQKDKVKICGEEFEFDSAEMKNLFLAFTEISRIKKSPNAFAKVAIVIKDGKVERAELLNQILKAANT